MRGRSTLAFLTIALLAACAAPRIDGRDADRARASIARVRRSVPAAKQQAFDSALRSLMANASPLPTLGDPRVRAAIDGRTGDDIIAAARDQRAAADRKREEEALRRDKQAIESQLASIRQSDREAAAKLGNTATVSTANAAMPGAMPGTALGSLVALTTTSAGDGGKYDGPVDPEVRARCTGWSAGKSDIFDLCVKAEMEGKNAVTGALPSGVPADVGQRIRDNCLRKYTDSYRLRFACENTDVGSIINIANHPEVMKTLRPERQQELHTLMGQ